jgi:hypothetical protein
LVSLRCRLKLQILLFPRIRVLTELTLIRLNVGSETLTRSALEPLWRVVARVVQLVPPSITIRDDHRPRFR